MCTAKLYGHCTDTVLSVDTRTDTTCWKVRQLTDSGYQDLQHHWLIHDRFLKRISDTICTTTARSCQQGCHYCSLIWCACTHAYTHTGYKSTHLSSSMCAKPHTIYINNHQHKNHLKNWLTSCSLSCGTQTASVSMPMTSSSL